MEVSLLKSISTISEGNFNLKNFKQSLGFLAFLFLVSPQTILAKNVSIRVSSQPKDLVWSLSSEIRKHAGPKNIFGKEEVGQPRSCDSAMLSMNFGSDGCVPGPMLYWGFALSKVLLIRQQSTAYRMSRYSKDRFFIEDLPETRIYELEKFVVDNQTCEIKRVLISPETPLNEDDKSENTLIASPSRLGTMIYHDAGDFSYLYRGITSFCEKHIKR